MHASYDAIYLSPHLDDAALSCGGQIAQRTARGERVLILTIMAGDPPNSAESDFARSLHDRWELDQAVVDARRVEDAAATALLGADAHYWSIPDCIYRTDSATGEPLYASEEALFGEVAEQERHDLVVTLAVRLSQLSAETIIAPLTVGNHVDHQIVRLAAERAWGPILCYYEDYPYAREAGAVEKVLNSAEMAAWQATVIPLDEQTLQTKLSAILAFRSQLGTFFADRADLEQQLRAYAAQVGGERIWSRP